MLFKSFKIVLKNAFLSFLISIKIFRIYIKYPFVLTFAVTVDTIRLKVKYYN